MDFLNRWRRSLKNNWRSPYWWKKSLLQISSTIWYGRIRKNEGELVMNKDWDNLIILDACRHDLYEEMKREKIDKRVTLGSTSKEFIEKNFGDSHDDIV